MLLAHLRSSLRPWCPPEDHCRSLQAPYEHSETAPYPLSDPGTWHLASAAIPCLFVPLGFCHSLTTFSIGLFPDPPWANPSATPNTTFLLLLLQAHSLRLNLAVAHRLRFFLALLRWLLTATVLPLPPSSRENRCVRLRNPTQTKEPPRVPRKPLSLALVRLAMRRYAAATWLP